MKKLKCPDPTTADSVIRFKSEADLLKRGLSPFFAHLAATHIKYNGFYSLVLNGKKTLIIP